MSIIEEIITLGEQLVAQRDAASDLWTWLPSHKVAEKHHGDYAGEHLPTLQMVLTESSMYIVYLREAAFEPSKALIDKICWNLCQTHDTTEMWAHAKQDPEAFRAAVVAAFPKGRSFTAEEREWFETCPCGEDHAEAV